jgi:hypothetical protein
MVRLPAPFNARLYEINEAFVRFDPEPLVAYLRSLRSDTIDLDVLTNVLNWMADRIDPAVTGGHKLVIKGPAHRPSGGKAFDRFLAIGEAMNQLMNDPADQRSEQAKVDEVATKFGCRDSKVRKDYRAWKKARDFYPIDE